MICKKCNEQMIIENIEHDVINNTLKKEWLCGNCGIGYQENFVIENCRPDIVFWSDWK